MNSTSLGQHAGQLLLELHKCHKDYKNCPILTMSGMIIDGTKVGGIFNLFLHILHLSYSSQPHGDIIF